MIINNKTSEIFISPYIKGDEAYFIEFTSRWQADNYLKKYNAKMIKSPIENPKIYDLNRIITEDEGQVKVYRLKEL
jgi:hypothetical protein